MSGNGGIALMPPSFRNSKTQQMRAFTNLPRNNLWMEKQRTTIVKKHQKEEIKRLIEDSSTDFQVQTYRQVLIQTF